MPAHIVAIIGGTGSFGQAMCNHLLQHTTSTVRIISRDELKQSVMRQTFIQYDDRLRFFLGDIRDYDRMCLGLKDVSVVYCAAALKQVDKGEYDPEEYVKTNIYGTANVMHACRACGVKRAIFLSSDKSVASVNLYGSTKAVAEKIWIRANTYSPHSTEYVVVRWGNVTGSRGSVFETWKRFLATGHPLPVTDPRMTRFWITLDEAVHLAEFAALHGPRGSILVPHLQAYGVPDLARAYGGEDVATVDVGIRPGEKLHETLIAPHEESRVTMYRGENVVAPQYYAIAPEQPSWHQPPSFGITWHPWQILDRYESGVWPYRMDTATLRQQMQHLGVIA